MIAASSTKQGGDDRRDSMAAKIHQYALAGEDEKILVGRNTYYRVTYYDSIAN